MASCMCEGDTYTRATVNSGSFVDMSASTASRILTPQPESIGRKGTLEKQGQVSRVSV